MLWLRPFSLEGLFWQIILAKMTGSLSVCLGRLYAGNIWQEWQVGLEILSRLFWKRWLEIINFGKRTFNQIKYILSQRAFYLVSFSFCIEIESQAMESHVEPSAGWVLLSLVISVLSPLTKAYCNCWEWLTPY